MEGWMIFGLLATGNFNFYTEVFMRRYAQNDVVTASPFKSLAFQSWWGIGAWFRIFSIWILWGFTLLLWVMTLIPGFYEADQLLYLLGGYAMGFIYLFRIAFMVIMFTLSLIFDWNDINDMNDSYNFYQYSNGFGTSANLPTIKTLNIYLMWEYNMVDYDFEIATMAGLYLGVQLYAPRYAKAEWKIKERRWNAEDRKREAEEQERKD
jgi:signal transduction histidine kinase